MEVSGDNGHIINHDRSANHTAVYICQNPLNVYLRSVHFSICKFHLSYMRERDKVHQTVIIKSSLYPTPMYTHIPSLPPSHSAELRDCLLKGTPEAAGYSLFPLPRVLPLPSAQGQLRELIPKQWSLNQGGRCLWLLQAPFSPFLILGNIPAQDQK